MKINKKNIASIIFDLLIIGLFLLLGISIYYNRALQNQIKERDRIINELSINNSNLRERILNKYFNIQYDSISSVEIFTLKEDYLPTEYHNRIVEDLTMSDSMKYVYLIYEYNTLVDKYNTSINKSDTLAVDYNTLVHKYNALLDKHNTTIFELDSINSIIKGQEIALNLIKKHFDIDYKTNTYDNKIEVSLVADKADSAFILLPFFRDRLQYDAINKCWNIDVKRSIRKE